MEHVTQAELIARGYAAAMRSGRYEDAMLCVELMEAECGTMRRAVRGRVRDAMMKLHDRTVVRLREWVEGRAP